MIAGPPLTPLPWPDNPQRFLRAAYLEGSGDGDTWFPLGRLALDEPPRESRRFAWHLAGAAATETADGPPIRYLRLWFPQGRRMSWFSALSELELYGRAADPALSPES